MDKVFERIILLRTKARLTQAEFAKKLNISSQLVSKWECGEVIATIEECLNVCSFFGVTLDYLIKGNISEQDKKVINREPTYEERVEDYKMTILAMLKPLKLEKHLDAIFDLTKRGAKLTVKDALSFDNYKLFCALIENKFVNDNNGSFAGNGNGVQAEMIINCKLKDIDFYKIAKGKSALLSAFVEGKLEWNDKIMLSLIDDGAFVQKAVGSGREYDDTYPIFGNDVFATRLLKEYCEKQLKK